MEKIQKLGKTKKERDARIRNLCNELKKIKNDERFRQIPVMMVTTESEKTNIVQAIQSGASNYTIKPFGMEELIKKIMECLGKGR